MNLKGTSFVHDANQKPFRQYVAARYDYQPIYETQPVYETRPVYGEEPVYETRTVFVCSDGYATYSGEDADVHSALYDCSYHTRSEQVQTGARTVQTGTKQVQAGTEKVQTGTKRFYVPAHWE